VGDTVTGTVSLLVRRRPMYTGSSTRAPAHSRDSISLRRIMCRPIPSRPRGSDYLFLGIVDQNMTALSMPNASPILETAAASRSSSSTAHFHNNRTLPSTKRHRYCNDREHQSITSSERHKAMHCAFTFNGLISFRRCNSGLGPHLITPVTSPSAAEGQQLHAGFQISFNLNVTSPNVGTPQP